MEACLAPAPQVQCPDPCPPCPEADKVDFDWGVEVSFGLVTLLAWELARFGLGRAQAALGRALSRRRASAPALEGSAAEAPPVRVGAAKGGKKGGRGVVVFAPGEEH